MNHCYKCDIVYEGKDCPLCDVIKEVEQLRKTIEELENSA